MIIDKRSLDRQAADWVREAVIEGRLPPGTRITEVSLAAEIGLSRSTVRTALQRLATDGLVVQRPYSGWEITELSVEDAVELYSLRYYLEGLAARLAAERIDPPGRAALQSAMEALRNALRGGNRRDIAEADLGIHRTITALSGHKRLLAFCELLSQSILIYYVMSTNRTMASTDALIFEHEELVNTILSGDADKAEALTRAHIHNAQRAIIENLVRRKTEDGRGEIDSGSSLVSPQV
jgi:DNA-binding GntR family transcriptional regulator